MHYLDARFNRRLLLFASLLLGTHTGAGSLADEPPFEKLVELNAKELFGAEAALKEGRVTLRFGAKGSFARAFRTSGGGGGRGFVSNADDLKEATMRENVVGGLGSAFNFAGLEGGEALSRFELADDFKISFRMRAPVIAPNASFLLRVNQEDARSHIQTSFFQDITVLEAGKPRRKASTDERFTGPPARWFHQKHADPPATQIEVVFKDKKLSISLTLYKEAKKPGEVVSVVSQDAIERPARGKVFIKFTKLNFGVADFVIEGKYSKEWAEAELARLRKEKRIRLRPEDPEPSDKKSEKKAKGAKGKVSDKQQEPSAKKSKRPKREPPDLSKPDPDAEVDL